eukprot:GHVU01023220.1.p1 GENE.GHVU01023220.1~~GHVU01023220.1.p1  ORF type:complete len:258 (-),score=35.78 GHVU01023220.1:1096-1869(-)
MNKIGQMFQDYDHFKLVGLAAEAQTIVREIGDINASWTLIANNKDPHSIAEATLTFAKQHFEAWKKCINDAKNYSNWNDAFERRITAFTNVEFEARCNLLETAIAQIIGPGDEQIKDRMSELKFELSKVGNDNAIQKLKEDIEQAKLFIEDAISYGGEILQPEPLDSLGEREDEGQVTIPTSETSTSPRPKHKKKLKPLADKSIRRRLSSAKDSPWVKDFNKAQLSGRLESVFKAAENAREDLQRDIRESERGALCR